MEKVSFQSLPKQSQFIFDNHKFACFAGGFGCGKTLAGCVKSLVLSQLMPNNFGLIGRLTYPELRDTTRRTFFEYCPPDWYSQANGGFFKEGENHLKLYNGSEVIFRHLDTISRKELLSLNLGWFFIDQAEEISEEIFLILQSRLRLNKVSRRYGFLACNMEGHNWIWHRFVDPVKRRLDTFLVESSTYDNVHNPPDYVKTLEQNYPEEWVKRYVVGSWDVFEGQVFPEFDPQVHTVDPFLIPNEWERVISIDHGLVNPTAALWGAIDFDGNCVAPETKLLTENLEWVEAGEIKKDDILVGFDEQVPATKKRRWRKSTVESVKRLMKPSYRLTLSDGTTVTCSADHQWLVETLGKRKLWKSTEELNSEWKLMRVLDTWNMDTSYGAGYLSAALDGEGSFGINQRGTMRLSFVQRDNEMLGAVTKELGERGFFFGNYERKNECNMLSVTRKKDIIRFLGSIRPQRLLPKFDIESMKGFSAFKKLTIVKKEFIGETEVVAIQTNTKTYVAEGIASHNCFIYDEYYQAQLPISVHAKAILEKTGDQPIDMWLIDPSTRAKNREKNGMPWSILEEYQDYGIYAVPANSEVLAGINRIKEYLKINPERLHYRTHQKGAPRLFIGRNCVNLLDELRSYHWKRVQVSSADSNIPEKPAKVKDHAVDSLRYMIMSRYEKTEKEDPKYAFVRRDERRRANDITREETQEEIWKSYNME